MATGLDFAEQFTVVNAPAGSGKTTLITKSIKNLIKTSNKKILCITYTNRATEQLNMHIDDESVDISTIHSFISNLLSPLFRKKEIISLYHDFFCEKIDFILTSQETKELERVERYRNRKEISKDIQVNKVFVYENTLNIYYGETQYSSYLYGSLSHDDLLLFAKEVFRKFPKVNNLISQKYSYIFIDEYQDTQSEILELFYNATINTTTKLVLVGDEMQQIYNDRVEEFEKVIDEVFYKDRSLNINWRSQKNIVTVLNNLYFDEDFKQEPSIIERDEPKLYLVKDLNDLVIQENALQLVLYNSELFGQIGASGLYGAFNEKYLQFNKYSTKQILTDMTMENPDEVMIILIFITDIIELFDNGKYGELIKRVSQFSYANEKLWKLYKHSDKVKIHDQLKNLSNKIKEEISLNELFIYLRENELISTEHIDEMTASINENEKFKDKIYNVKYKEFLNCYKECKNQSISTQHAVKGEGHDSIALKISDGSNPNVQMHLFLELWSRNIFDFKQLKIINSEIKVIKEICSELIGFKLSGSKISSEIYKAKFDIFLKFINDVLAVLGEQKSLSDYPLIKSSFETFFSKSNLSNFKKCLTLINRLEGIVLAYKLFYVGCSRAKQKLDVYICIDKIKEFEADLKTRMESIGFQIEVSQL